MAIENKQIYTYSVYGIGAVVWGGVIRNVANALVDLLPAEYSAVGGFPLTLLFLPLTIALTVVLCEVVRRNERASKYGIEVISELKKVTWPNWKEIRGSTLIVVVMTIVVAFVLFFFDKIFDWLYRVIMT